MGLDNFPGVPSEIVEALNKEFPSRDPQKHDTPEDTLWRGGQRSVVNFLSEVLERQRTLTV